MFLIPTAATNQFYKKHDEFLFFHKLTNK